MSCWTGWDVKSCLSLFALFASPGGPGFAVIALKRAIQVFGKLSIAQQLHFFVVIVVVSSQKKHLYARSLACAEIAPILLHAPNS